MKVYIFGCMIIKYSVFGWSIVCSYRWDRKKKKCIPVYTYSYRFLRTHFLMSSICLRADVTLVLCRRSFRNKEEKKTRYFPSSSPRYPLTTEQQTIIIISHSIFLSLNRQQLDSKKRKTSHRSIDCAAIVPEFQSSERLHKTIRIRIDIII